MGDRRVRLDLACANGDRFRFAVAHGDQPFGTQDKGDGRQLRVERLGGHGQDRGHDDRARLVVEACRGLDRGDFLPGRDSRPHQLFGGFLLLQRRAHEVDPHRCRGQVITGAQFYPGQAGCGRAIGDDHRKAPGIVKRPAESKSLRLVQPYRRLEALMAVADSEVSLILTGNGDVLEPEAGIIGIGSGGNYALSAARALIDMDLDAEQIVRKAMGVAADICVYTNDQLTIETLESTTE